MRVGLERETIQGGVLSSSDVQGNTAEHDHWRARLSLSFEARAGKTVLAHSLHEGPLRVQRPFYPERDGTCHLYVLHPPGGVAGGDQLHIEASLAAGTHALITTPGAGKLYKTRGPTAHVEQVLKVEGDACLEWLPQETIVFDGAEARVRTHIELDAGARFAGWELFCLGRPKSDERFERGRLRTELKLSRAGQLCFMERGSYRGSDAMLQQPWGLSGLPVFGLFVIADARVDEGWVEQARAAVSCDEPSLFSITQLPGLLLARFLGVSTLEARAAFEQLFHALRPLYANTTPIVPRIWRT